MNMFALSFRAWLIAGAFFIMACVSVPAAFALSFSKPGDNGTVSCATFCAGPQWGPVGAAIGEQLTYTDGLGNPYLVGADVTTVPGYLSHMPMVCTCEAQGAPVGFLDAVIRGALVSVSTYHGTRYFYQVNVAGWCYDSANSTPVFVVTNDTAGSGVFTGTVPMYPRPDVNAAGYPGNDGYSFSIGTAEIGDKIHTFCDGKEQSGSPKVVQ